jgi:hypothetical protein
VPYSAATFMILPHLWLLLEGQWPLLTACRLAYLLEKAHVQAPRRLGNQYPVHPLTYVFVSLQGRTLWGRTGERRRKLATRGGRDRANFAPPFSSRWQPLGPLDRPLR